MNFPALVAIAGTAIGVTIALLGMAFSSAPGWRHQRGFYLLALASAVYCACDVFPLIDASLPVRRVALACSFAAVGFAMAGWLSLGRATFGSDAMGRLARVLIPANLVLSALALIPGVVVSREVTVRTVSWLGLTYADVVPTSFGQALLPLFGVSMLGFGWHAFRAHRRGVPEAGLYVVLVGVMFGIFILDSLAFVGWVNGPYLATPTLTVGLIAISVRTVRRFIANAHALDDLSRQLELRVEERTRELSEANAALARAEKLAALGQLAAGVAHEINNPAAAVTANLSYLRECLAEGAAPDDALQCLDESRAGMARIKNIVRGMLDAGRTASAQDAVRDTTDVAKAVESAVALVRPVVPPAATIEVSVPPGLTTWGSAQLLEQILTNLIVNAGHAIASGRGQGRIQVKGGTCGAEISLDVQDDGCGMDRETQKRLFEPFFTTKPVGQGTGLGLSVTAGLVKSLGGTLSVESALGVGTVMKLRLPAALKA